MTLTGQTVLFVGLYCTCLLSSDEWKEPQEAPNASRLSLAGLREGALGGWGLRLSRRGVSRSCRQPTAVVFGCTFGGHLFFSWASHHMLGMICPPLTPIPSAMNTLEGKAVEMWSIILGTESLLPWSFCKHCVHRRSACHICFCVWEAHYIIRDESPRKGA